MDQALATTKIGSPHPQENKMKRTASSTLVDLETKFWQAMVDRDTDAALNLLCEPALMISSHGAMKFDHAGYRRMADQGSIVIQSFEFSKMEVMFPNDATAILSYRVRQAVAPRGQGRTKQQEMHDTSTWVRASDGWRCALHTETPVEAR
jgi:ketosteroid isomerase-like protein